MITIKYRFTNTVICSFDVATVKEAAEQGKANLRGADLCYANLYGADLSGADLYGADLCGADLRGADLSGADLYCADLRGADLYGAKIEDEVIKIDPINITSGLTYHCLITDNYMRLGCKRYTHTEWNNFSDTEISEMDSKALSFWTDNKDWLLSLCKTHNKKSSITN